jgi:hypothetical protein
MTAMCDVAFLLLTFFVMTSTAKIPEALPVILPLQQFRLNYLNLSYIECGGKGWCFDLKGKVRMRTLELMGEVRYYFY